MTEQFKSEQPATKDKGHKGMDGPLVPAKVLLARHNYDPPDYDPVDQGGILTTMEEPSGYVRPPGFRGIPEGLTAHDVKGIYLVNKSPEALGFDEVDSGLEAEYFGFDTTGGFVSMMNDGDPFYEALQEYNRKAEKESTDKIDYTREMIANCVELTFPHGTDISTRNTKYLKKIRAIIDIAESVDVNIAPIANIPHRRVNRDEITKDDYTHKLTFDVQGWDAAQHFDVASIQPHTEIIDHDAARKTINYLQFVTPILFGATLSGPFMDGRLEPDLKERYSTAPDYGEDSWKEATLEYLEQGEHQSYRPFGRFFGSPSGGILRQPIPTAESEFLASIGEKLEKGEVPTAGREGGHHTDRYRPDIPPHGTLELCTFDPAGGRTERVIAIREFTRALGWKMQMHFLNGTFAEVQERYPALFGKEPSEDSFETAHWNTMAVAKDGSEAKLQGMDDKEYNTKALWNQLQEFVQEPLVDEDKNIRYKGLPSPIIVEIGKAFMDPSPSFDNFKDANGFTSTRGYYQTGIGNISQWMMQGAKDRVAAGIDEKDAVKAVTVDVAQSFHSHIKTLPDEALNQMYTPADQNDHPDNNESSEHPHFYGNAPDIIIFEP